MSKPLMETVSYSIWDSIIYNGKERSRMFENPIADNKPAVDTNMYLPSALPFHNSFEIKEIAIKTGNDIKLMLEIGSKTYYEGFFFTGYHFINIIPLRIEEAQHFRVIIRSKHILPFEVIVSLSGELTRPVY